MGESRTRIPTVCHICSYFPEYGGTFIESILFLSRYCRDYLQLDTFCVFPEMARNRSWLSKLDEAGIGYGFVPYKRNVVKQIRGFFSDREPVILHSHFFFFDLTVVLLKYTAFREARIIWHYHSRSVRTVKQWFRDVLKIRLVFNYLGDCCIAVGDGVHKDVSDAGMAQEKAMLIYNGVNTDRFLSKYDVALEVRKNLGFSEEDMIFMLLGWSPSIKGVDVFLRAAEMLSQKRKECRFLIVGTDETKAFVSNSLGDSDLAGSLRVVHFVKEFSILLNGIDVFVSASRSEGFGYAVIEAMATERLVLCSDIDPVRQTYGRSEGVWVYQSENWKTLAELMEKSVELPLEERQCLGLRNRQHVIQNYSLDQWGEKVGRVYKALIG